MSKPPPRRMVLILTGLALAVLVGAGGLFAFSLHRQAPTPPPFRLPPEPAEASAEQINHFCGACHMVPSPESFPRHEWRKQISIAYNFFQAAHLEGDYPSIESAALYYERRAPEAFEPLANATLSTAAPVAWERHGFAYPEAEPPVSVSSITVAALQDKTRADIVVSDVRRNEVLALTGLSDNPKWKTLARLKAPARTEVVDLDGDGLEDVLVAVLGEFFPTDAKVGSVVWLRGQKDGTFQPVTLLEDVGRVADVRAADFNNDGKRDLLVAVFGWNRTGEILYLQNETTDWSRPVFRRQVIDPRHGTIHVPVADLNGDGLVDFVALISQEHEQVVAFLNKGNGQFRGHTLFTGPHPAFGSSGVSLVDLEGDGDLDILFTNGDVMDVPHLPRPDHQVHWLENRATDWASPEFVTHSLLAMPGVERALAADFDGDGDQDIIAVSFLPPDRVPMPPGWQPASVVLLIQESPGQFRPHCLETLTADHFTCAVGDLYGDGRVHLVIGNYDSDPNRDLTDAIVVWKNMGRRE